MVPMVVLALTDHEIVRRILLHLVDVGSCPDAAGSSGVPPGEGAVPSQPGVPVGGACACSRSQPRRGAPSRARRELRVRRTPRKPRTSSSSRSRDPPMSASEPHSSATASPILRRPEPMDVSSTVPGVGARPSPPGAGSTRAHPAPASASPTIPPVTYERTPGAASPRRCVACPPWRERIGATSPPCPLLGGNGGVVRGCSGTPRDLPGSSPRPLRAAATRASSNMCLSPCTWSVGCWPTGREAEAMLSAQTNEPASTEAQGAQGLPSGRRGGELLGRNCFCVCSMLIRSHAPGALYPASPYPWWSWPSSPIPRSWSRY